MGFIGDYLERLFWKSGAGKDILDYLPEAISGLQMAELALEIAHHTPEVKALERLRQFLLRLQAKTARM